MRNHANKTESGLERGEGEYIDDAFFSQNKGLNASIYIFNSAAKKTNNMFAAYCT